MPGYRVEYAGSGRSKCNGKKPCKGTPIAKGELRFGTWVLMNDHGSFKWRHWACLTPEVLKNVLESLEDKVEELDGFEDLKEEDREKVKHAFENIEAVMAEKSKKDDEAKSIKKVAKSNSKKRKSKGGNEGDVDGQPNQTETHGETIPKETPPKKKRVVKPKKVLEVD